MFSRSSQVITYIVMKSWGGKRNGWVKRDRSRLAIAGNAKPAMTVENRGAKKGLQLEKDSGGGMLVRYEERFFFWGAVWKTRGQRIRNEQKR